MSLGELFIVCLVAVLVCKPDDIKFIFKELYQLKAYISKIRDDVMGPINEEMKKIEVQNLKDDIEQINFYLQKITDMNETYEGEYSLNSIRAYYEKLIKKDSSQHPPSKLSSKDIYSS